MNHRLFSTFIALTAACFVLLVSISVVLANGNGRSKEFSLRDVRGDYAFSFQGEIVGVGPVTASGVLSADGKGNITQAERTISVNGVPVVETFTCTLTVNPNGTGSAVCPIDSPAPGFPAVETFDFALEDRARGFRFVGTTPGIAVLGSGRRQWVRW